MEEMIYLLENQEPLKYYAYLVVDKKFEVNDSIIEGLYVTHTGEEVFYYKNNFVSQLEMNLND